MIPSTREIGVLTASGATHIFCAVQNGGDEPFSSDSLSIRRQVLINACARETLGSWLAKRGGKTPASGNVLVRFNCLEQEEDGMYKILVMIAAALVVVSAGSLVSNRAEAGASASAATKYSRASSAGYQWTSWWRRHRVTGTSEYSSSNRSRRR